MTSKLAGEKKNGSYGKPGGIVTVSFVVSTCLWAGNLPAHSAPSTRVLDHGLQRQIEKRIRQNPDLNLVKVKVHDRQVALLGGVPSNVDRQMAFAIANAVPGTGKVRNRRVTLLDTTQRHIAMGADAEAGRQPDFQRR